jgi:hypothetical protein
MFRGRRDPGAGMPKDGIYEVWGDVVEYAAGDGPEVIRVIRDYLERSSVAEYFNCQLVETKQDGRHFLTLQWGNIRADVDARPFGEHLDVYAILSLQRGLLDSPNPLARIADLEAWQRRDLQVFQTILKQAMEEALNTVDEGWM